MTTKLAAVPAEKKAPVRVTAQAKRPPRRRAVRKSSRPAGDLRVSIADIAPAKKALKTSAAKPAPASAADPAAVLEAENEKVVRDGFTMPRADYEKFRTLKSVCLSGGVAVKKSELLRAGLHALEALPIPDLLARIQALPPIKAGRKKK